MFDIVSIGEILIDLTQNGKNSQNIPIYAANPGGAPANVAVAASKLGAQTAFCGMVGKDAFGTYLKETLEQYNVSTDFLCFNNMPTTMAIVSVNAKGERSFQFVRGADCALTTSDVNIYGCMNTKILHFGSVSLTAEPARKTTLDVVSRARQNNICISYDPNYRASLWESEEEAVKWMKKPLSMVDILKISDEELSILTGTNNLEEGSYILSEYGISLILITMGSEGAYYRYNNKTGIVAGIKTTVVDTNGAGDTFLGALLYGLAQEANWRTCSIDRLESHIALANRAASFTCSGNGAIPSMPTKAQLMELEK
jgi:fructokinase